MRSLLVVVAASAVLLVGCSGDETTATPQTTGASAPVGATPTSPPAATPTASPSVTKAIPGTVIRTAGSQFGKILFDGTGQAIYLFDKEQATRAECYGECAEAWPPVLTRGSPVAAGGVDAVALGTTKRADGSTQVTYGGHPLYYYAHEGKNEVLCHNVREYGGRWLVLTPAGEAAAP
jgi:predicted lipoprotein with Yx(FWY)xxD motif